jgi:hypothetical protein
MNAYAQTIDLDVLKKAIENKTLMFLAYPPGIRVIEPHALGYAEDGSLLLRAWQLENNEEKDKPQGWRLFKLERSKWFDLKDAHFPAPRVGYKKSDSAMKGGIVAEL